MIVARRFVIGIVVLDKLRCVLRQRIHHAACQSIAAAEIVLSALGVHGLLFGIAGVGGVFTVKIAVGIHAGHVVHGHGGGRLDAGILCGGVHRHAAPAADADDPDALRVNILLHGQEVHRRAEILCIDVRGCHVPGLSAALTGKGRVKGDRQIATLRHLLCV